MQVTSEKISHTIVHVTVRENVAEMQRYRQIAANTLAENRQFPGFRKGDEVPADVVAREVGDERLMQETLNQALQVLYPKALKKLSLQPVDMGEIIEVKSISPLEVVLKVEITPEVELNIKKVEKIKIEIDAVAVTDEELQKELDAILDRGTHYHPRGHHGHHHDENGEVPETTLEIQSGDKVRVNATGYDKKGGTTDDRMQLTDFEVTIGANMMIPGFEDALIGAKEGDVVEFEVTFPAEYHSADFAGKNAFFVVTILSVEYPHKPEWNEAFIERVWGKKLSVSDFRVEYREAMLQDRRDKARTAAEEKLIDALIAAHDVVAGDKMVAREVDNLWMHHNTEIEKQGMKIDDYLSHLKTSAEVFKKEQIQPVATKRVKSMLLMEALRKHYKPEIADEIVVQEIRTIFARYSSNPEFEARILELSKPGTGHFNEVKDRLEYRAVIDRFLKN